MAADSSETEPLINPNPELQSYYASLESRIGYRLVLGETRHYGYYEKGTWNPFPIGRALRRMEGKLLEVLSLPPGSRMLDAGCGVAHVSLYMARHGMYISFIDIVARAIEKARRNIRRSSWSPGQGQVTAQRMDYHHLESIPDTSYDGVYTMETFVHATDPEAVLAGFYRVLRPGGRIALFEYDHVLNDVSTPGDLAESMRQINTYAAMPTNMRSTPGLYKRMLEDAGFHDVVVRDFSENIRPMLMLFWILAWIPFFFVRLFRLEKYFINTVAGYQGYRGLQFWRYLAVTATKPGPPIEVSKTK